MRAPLKATVLLAVLVLASFSVASGQAVFVNTAEITGLTADGKIPAGGTNLVIPVRYQNAGEARTAISNGFDFLGDVTYAEIIGAWNPAYPWNWELAFPAGCYPPACYPYFDQGTFINYFDAALQSATPTTAKGVGFAGLTGASGSGLPVGFDDVAVTITINDVAGNACDLLTMDSTWWEPANFWLWSGVAENVSWGGPYEFEVEGCIECTDPVITSTPVTDGQEGVLYTYNVDATGDPAPGYALTVAPAGMVIDPVSGIITWTPADGQAGSHDVTVVASNDCENDATQSFVINVIEAYVAPVIVEIPDQSATVGDAYTYDVEVSAGNPDPTFSLVTAPAGMTIDENSGVINWAVDVAGDHTVTVAANNVAGTDEETFVLSVAIPCTDPVITSTPVTDGQEGVLYTYDVDASGDPAPTYALSVFPAGMGIDPVSGVITWTPADGQAGSHDVTVVATNDCDNDATQSFVVNVIEAYEVPVIVKIQNQSAYVGDAYTYDVEVSAGNPAPTFSLVAYPTGMTIDENSGVINWAVDAAGDHTITVAATNVAGTDEETFTLSVSIPCTDPVITSTPVTEGQEGEPYTYDVDATGDPAPTFSLAVFPAGMVIDAVSGVITWTPADGQAGSHAVQVVAGNDCDDVTQSFVITVIPAYEVPVIEEIADQDAKVNDVFVYNVDVSAGYPTPTFSLVTAPAGMTIDPNSGVINWTVDAVGDHTVTVAATNMVGTDEETFILSVTDCVPNVLLLWPDQTIYLKSLPEGRTMPFGIFCDDPDGIILSSIRVFNIPPYTSARIEEYEGVEIAVTDAFVMRFLGAGGFRPIPSEGYLNAEYPVYYDRTDGSSETLWGTFDLSMSVGDVTFDGLRNIDDVIFMTDYLFNRGQMATLFGEKMPESMDVDQSQRVDLLDIRALLELTGL